MDDQTKMNKQSNWLNEFAGDVTSQCGEDGIIEKAIQAARLLTRGLTD